jgi:BirA family transcriptional regulator, biotin operon repressor / biotin---[acetyl-CoA-carboxylase] ligase
LIGRIAAARRALPQGSGPAAPPWRLRSLPVCGSTERELDRWLTQAPPTAGTCLADPMAVIARRQRFGHGQQGRVWVSPPGGVWLSAALPWPEDPAAAAAPGLAVAVGLALQLEALGAPVRLRWPNDLLLEGGKLAGLLPRLRLRGGHVRWARVGVGLNGRNRVPAGAINLAAVLGRRGTDPLRLTAVVLAALEWAIGWAARPEPVRCQAEARLLLPAGPVWQEGEAWQPLGLAPDGGLVLGAGARRMVLQRDFSPPWERPAGWEAGAAQRPSPAGSS